MSEIDYQMALLLQHRFEQEYKSHKRDHDSDYELAKQLQEQFEREQAVEKPPVDLVYQSKKPQLNSSKSLTDPSWELVDPTPDIHTLFMAFNQRYFWNKLLAVCVSWSKKMTSCAGVCSYQGRGGMCSITLSEPLLKLRPRKDLVETLLHEMIHAYLFVTHNNRDRDGHGPEFHKHMFRINKESGTNITVYHNFHDEVRLYQQHWWRCNGPCQSRKPYFGMVRRATNRAPGPNDRWWAEHSRTCGGSFIKIKEPEKTDKKTKKDLNSTKKGPDIRKYISSTSGTSGSSNIKSFKDLQGGQVRGRSNSASTIVVTNKTNTSTKTATTDLVNKTTSTSNIVGFKDLTNTSTSTSKPSVKKSNSLNTTIVPSTSQKASDDFLAVRNHWANKFNTKKRSSPDKSEVPINDTQCPVCSENVPMSDLNNHLDVCLTNPYKKSKSDKKDLKECPLCNEKIASCSFDRHVEKCLHNLYDNELKPGDSKLENEEKVACLACGKQINKIDLNTHLEECMIDIFDNDVDGSDDKQVEFNCPLCMEVINESKMQDHIDSCLKVGNTDLVQSWTDDDF